MSLDKIDGNNSMESIDNSGVTRLGKKQSSASFPPMYNGNQFLFINASQDFPVDLRGFDRKGNKTPSSEKPGPFAKSKEITVSEPIILSRYQYSYLLVKERKLNPDKPDNSDENSTTEQIKKFQHTLTYTSGFKYICPIHIIVTDKKIYKPGENIRVAIFAPSLANISVYLVVSHAIPGARALHKERILIDSNGVGLCNIPGIETGMYDLELLNSNDRYYTDRHDKVTFSVAEYSLSLLEAKLLKYKIFDRKLFIDARVTRLNTPFTGKISMEICNNRTGREISAKVLPVIDGIVSSDFEIPDSLAPFHIKIITEYGGTAEIHLPEKTSGLKDEIPLGKMGNHFTGSIHPIPGSRDLGWFNATLSSRGAFPLESWEIFSDKAVLHSNSDLKKAQVVLINPVNGEFRVFNFDDITRGQALTFDIDFPYSVIHAATWGDTPMESWGIVFKKTETGLKLDVPEVIEPGQEIKVKLKSSKPVKCLLTIYDSRIKNDDPAKRIGTGIYKAISNYRNLSSKELKKIDVTIPDPLTVSEYIKSLETQEHHYEIARCIPEHLAQHYKVLPIDVFDNFLILAVKEQVDPIAIEDIALITGYNVITVNMGEDLIEKYSEKFFGSYDLAEVQETVKCISFDSPGIRLSNNIPIPGRNKFLDIIHFEMIDLDGTVERIIKAGDQPVTWQCCAYAIDGFDFFKVEREILSTKDCIVEIDTPTVTEEGDEIEVKVIYNTGSVDSKGTLELSTPDEKRTVEVAGEGSLGFILTKPGEVTAEIRSGESSDRVEKNINSLRKGITTISHVRILHEGETVSHNEVEILPSMSGFVEDCIESLLGYPYGCAEQTSAKLYALSIAYHYALKGKITRKPEDIEKFIKPGLYRLNRFFYSSGMFSLWEGGTPSVDVTTKVAENLVPYNDLPLSMAKEFLDIASNYLKKYGYTSNRLLPLGKEFLSEGELLHDLVNFCIYNRDSEKLPAFSNKIKDLMKEDKQGVYWEGKYPYYWSGNLEATCDALAALWIAGETKFCLSTVKPIIENLKEGRLYSTSDTVAFLKLLDIMEMNFAEEVEITGEIINPFENSKIDKSASIHTSSNQEPQLIKLLNKLRVSGKVKAVNGEVMVRTVEERKVDYLEGESNFPFNLKLYSKSPDPGKSMNADKTKTADNHITEKTSQPIDISDSQNQINIPVDSEVSNESHQDSKMEIDSANVILIKSKELPKMDILLKELQNFPKKSNSKEIVPSKTSGEILSPSEYGHLESPNWFIDIKNNESGLFKLPLGKKATLTIEPSGWSVCPLCRILLPGNVALLKSGGNVQQACFPIKTVSNKKQNGVWYIENISYHEPEEENHKRRGFSTPLTIEIAAIRKGRGKLFVVLTDMYDSEKKGINRGIEVVVE